MIFYAGFGRLKISGWKSAIDVSLKSTFDIGDRIQCSKIQGPSLDQRIFGVLWGSEIFKRLPCLNYCMDSNDQYEVTSSMFELSRHSISKSLSFLKLKFGIETALMTISMISFRVFMMRLSWLIELTIPLRVFLTRRLEKYFI